MCRRVSRECFGACRFAKPVVLGLVLMEPGRTSGNEADNFLQLLVARPMASNDENNGERVSLFLSCFYSLAMLASELLLCSSPVPMPPSRYLRVTGTPKLSSQ